ncbi:MAG: PP2C family protein-serine/threonine phosphatase [Pseudomonadota bacterium]
MKKFNCHILTLLAAFIYILIPCKILYSKSFSAISDELSLKAQTLGIEESAISRDIELIRYYEKRYETLKNRLEKTNKWEFTKKAYFSIHRASNKDMLSKIIMEIDSSDKGTFANKINTAQSWFMGFTSILEELSPSWILASNADELIDKYEETQKAKEEAISAIEIAKQKNLEKAKQKKEKHRQEGRVLFATYYQAVTDYLNGDFYASYKGLKQTKGILKDGEEAEFGAFLDEQIANLETYFLEKTRESVNLVLASLIKMDYIEAKHASNGYEHAANSRIMALNEIAYDLNSDRSEVTNLYGKTSEDTEPIAVKRVKHAIDFSKYYEDAHLALMTYFDKNHANIDLEKIAWGSVKALKGVAAEAIIKAIEYRFGRIKDTDSTWNKLDEFAQRFSVGALQGGLTVLKEIINPVISIYEEKIELAKREELLSDAFSKAKKTLLKQKAFFPSAEEFDAHVDALAEDIYSNKIFSIIAKELSVPESFKDSTLMTKQNMQKFISLASVAKDLKTFQTVAEFSKSIIIEAALFYCGGVIAKTGVSLVFKTYKAARAAQLGTTVVRQSLLRTTALQGLSKTLVFTAFFTAFKAPVDGMIQGKSFLQMLSSLPSEYYKYFEMFMIAGAIGFGFNNTIGKMMHHSSFFTDGSKLVLREFVAKNSGKWVIQQRVVNELTRISKFLKTNMEIGSQAVGFTLYDELKEGLFHGDTSFKGFWNDVLMNFINFYALHMATATIGKFMEPPLAESAMYLESKDQRLDRQHEDYSFDAKAYYDRSLRKIYFTEEFKKLSDQEKLELFKHEQKHAFFESLPLSRQKTLLRIFKESGNWEKIVEIVLQMKPEIHRADELSILSEALAIHEELLTRQSNYNILKNSESALLRMTTDILTSDRIIAWLDGNHEYQEESRPENPSKKSDKARLRSETILIEPVRSSTRGDGRIELQAASFKSSEIETSSVKEHLARHMDGQTAGSQFNRDLFADAQAVVDFAISHLPETIKYDQHGRAEFTIVVKMPHGIVLGHSQVASLEAIKANFPDTIILTEARIEGGKRGEADGVQGTWYPEMSFNKETGKFEVIKGEDGIATNPEFKFEPDASIAYVDAQAFAKASATNKLTVIIEKNTATVKPEVKTIFPGDNAPAFPAIIGKYGVDTVKADSPEVLFWNKHVFVKDKSQVTRPDRLYGSKVFENLLDRIAPRFRRITPENIMELDVGLTYRLDENFKLTSGDPSYILYRSETGLTLRCLNKPAVLVDATGKKFILVSGSEKALAQGDRVYKSDRETERENFLEISFYKSSFEGAINPSELIRNLNPGESLYFTHDSQLNLIPIAIRTDTTLDATASIRVFKNASGELFVEFHQSKFPIAILTAGQNLRTVDRNSLVFHLNDGDIIGLYDRKIDPLITERSIKIIAPPLTHPKPTGNAAENIRNTKGSFGVKVTGAFGEFSAGTSNGKLESYALSDIARPKKLGPNEDGVAIFKLRRKAATTSEYYVLSVDGMGGGGSGDRAMKIAIDLIPKRIMEELKKVEGITEASVTRIFDSVIGEYNTLLNQGEIGASSGVCLSLARIYERNPGQLVAELFWFGDSKAVLIHDAKVVYATKDHSLLTGFEERGEEITPEIERLWGHVVTRALKPKADPGAYGFHEINMLQGAVLVQASDGLWDFVKPKEVAQIIKPAKTAEEATNLLRDEALRRMDAEGHGDNLNIAVTFVK